MYHSLLPNSKEAALQGLRGGLVVALLLSAGTAQAQPFEVTPGLHAIGEFLVSCVNGDFESTPSRSQLQRLARAIRRDSRASPYLKRAVKEGPVGTR
jgi:hypothetical protein